MKYLNQILIRVGLLLVILIMMNWVYTRFFYEKDLQRYSPIVNLVREINPDTKILYLGESSNKTYGESDLDKRKISEMISDYYPSLVIDDITKPAAHAGIYYHLLRQLPEDSNVETILVTLNLRSFGYDWVYSNLESPLQKSLVLLKPYPPLFNRFLLSFKAYFNMPEKERSRLVRKKWREETFDTLKGFEFPSVFEWDRGLALRGVRNDDGSYAQELTELGCHYIKSYAHDIDTTSHPRIKDFVNIINLAEKRGWNLVFILMAENIEKAGELVGPQLVDLMSGNRDKLKVFFQQKDVVVVDNLQLLGNDHFIDQNWTTEHYFEKGRRQIAFQTAEKTAIFHGEDFIPGDGLSFAPSVFFNNCENGSHWGQDHTITDEKAYSGLRSSMISNQQPYSITFEGELAQISQSKRDEINVSFHAWFERENLSPKLVIDITDFEGQQHWSGYDLEPDIPTDDKGWSAYRFKQKLNLSNFSAKSVKVYLLHDQVQPAYIDDLRIEFR